MVWVIPLEPGFLQLLIKPTIQRPHVWHAGSRRLDQEKCKTLGSKALLKPSCVDVWILPQQVVAGEADCGDVIWEPSDGLVTSTLVVRGLKRLPAEPFVAILTVSFRLTAGNLAEFFILFADTDFHFHHPMRQTLFLNMITKLQPSLNNFTPAQPSSSKNP